jgi:phospholipase C
MTHRMGFRACSSHKWRIYACDSFPNVAMLKGISRTFDIDDFDEDFASDVASPSYDAAYTFIEPS